MDVGVGSPCAYLPAAVGRIVLSADQIAITLRNDHESTEPTTIGVPWQPAPVQRQRAAILPCHGVSEDAARRPMRVEAHAKLIQALRQAHAWRDELLADPAASTHSIAEREGRSERSERSVRMILSLAFVDPAIITAALERHLPRGFSMSRLTDLPADWREQRRRLGLPAAGPL